MQQIKLIFEGDPMPKQSVIQGKTWSGKKVFYQPEEKKEREFLYRQAIKKQLPKDFKPFTKWVQVVELVYIHSATKEQLKHKKKSAWLKIGGLIPKPTRPDLIDNLSKLLFDSMSKKRGEKTFVYNDDGLVYITANSSKWYGLEPRIEITLLGE